VIPENIFKVYVKPGRSKDSFDGFDEEKKAYVISLKARALENKANKALLGFLKDNGVKARIKSGEKSRIKVLEKI
jgi:uncharacterized protein (TIGR00251 family)